MKFEIKNRWTSELQFTAEIECKEDSAIEVKVGLSVKWAIENKADLRFADLRFADLRFADLQSANLRFADLQSANLRSANLQSADLRFADLRFADLRFANLRSANLQSADLRFADLQSANLRFADLRFANLQSADLNETTRLPTGETWQEYVQKVVPALLTAGGKTIAGIVETGAWDCHDWANCPMAEAFGVHDENACPILLRPRVVQFVQLFDAGLIPCPVVASADVSIVSIQGK